VFFLIITVLQAFILQVYRIFFTDVMDLSQQRSWKLS